MRELLTNSSALAFILGIVGGFIWMLLVFLGISSKVVSPLLLRLKGVWQIVVPVVVGAFIEALAVLFLRMPLASLIIAIPTFAVSSVGTAWLLIKVVAWH